MAVGDHGRAGAVLVVKVVIKQDTASVTIPHQPTVDLAAVEFVHKKGIAMNVLFIWHNANINAITRSVHSRAVATLAIKHRQQIQKDVTVSIYFLAKQLPFELFLFN